MFWSMQHKMQPFSPMSISFSEISHAMDGAIVTKFHGEIPNPLNKCESFDLNTTNVFFDNETYLNMNVCLNEFHSLWQKLKTMKSRSSF